MIDIKNLLIALAIAVVAAGGGYAVGMSAGPAAPSSDGGGEPMVSEAPEKVTISENKVVKFTSKSVSGKVKSLSGSELTLEEDGDSLDFSVSPQARVTRITIPSPTELPEESETPVVPKQDTISLSQLKVGDRVDATLTSQPDGSFAATEITVLVEGE